MSSDIQTLLTEAERSFRKACEQIVQLNRRLDEMAKRYDKASRENHRSFRYSLRLRMAVTEGVRNMYYEYAANKADEITHLRCQVARDDRSGNEEEAELDDEVREGGGDDQEGESFEELNMGPEMLRAPMLVDPTPSGSVSDDDDDNGGEERSVSDMEDDAEEVGGVVSLAEDSNSLTSSASDDVV